MATNKIRESLIKPGTIAPSHLSVEEEHIAERLGRTGHVEATQVEEEAQKRKSVKAQMIDHANDQSIDQEETQTIPPGLEAAILRLIQQAIPPSNTQTTDTSRPHSSDPSLPISKPVSKDKSNGELRKHEFTEAKEAKFFTYFEDNIDRRRHKEDLAGGSKYSCEADAVLFRHLNVYLTKRGWTLRRFTDALIRSWLTYHEENGDE